MKSLLIFDDSISIDSIMQCGKLNGMSHVDLFPLIEDFTLDSRVANALEKVGIESSVRVNSSDLIQKSIGNLRKTLGSWASGLSDAKINNRAVKDWLMLPRFNVSAWWFSLLSERNVMKSNSFLGIAQVQSIAEALGSRHYDMCMIATSDSSLGRSLEDMICSRKVRVCFLGARGKDTWIVRYIYDGVRIILKILLRSIWAHIRLGSISERLNRCKLSTLVVSYFPYIDKSEAKKNILVNKYAYPLQNKFKELNMPIAWLMMHASLCGNTFRDSIELIRKFSRAGEHICILEEFMRIRDFALVLWLWMRQIVICRRLYASLAHGRLYNASIGSECRYLIKDLWDASFYGKIGAEGVIFSIIFRRVFGSMHSVIDCIYYAEMHAWEKALNAAKKMTAPKVRTIAYQHSTSPRNWFPYFPDPGETSRSLRGSDMPLPDIFACCGELQGKRIEKVNYPKVQIVEAVRYLHIDEILSSHPPKKSERPSLFVAGSIDYTETRALLSLLHESFPDSDCLDVICKGHPAQELEEIFNDLGIDPERCRYKIYHGDLEDCLRTSWAVLVPSSTIAIEALAYGCEVITPIFPDSVMMNPAADFEGVCHKVTRSSELIGVLDRIISGERLKSRDEYGDFIRSYWCFNKNLPRWTKLLTEGGCCAPR